MKVALVLFVVLVILAVVSNREMLLKETGTLTLMVTTLLVILFIVGVGLPRLLGVSWKNAKTIGVEVGIQNSTMALALSGLLAVSADMDTMLPAFALPAAVYSVVMYLLIVPYILIFRKVGN